MKFYIQSKKIEFMQPATLLKKGLGYSQSPTWCWSKCEL